ncbi:hypothetical protein Patl1_21992 [Pistacia atlantica]|uniref:Uncharacterized protein n=1 Tax=Pistacia atlantica TaxID=434234 RepID=A0ACC1BML2_9ROSI|nr:hypothetical protein Patl1_21992 [Pistacia atlantica]
MEWASSVALCARSISRSLKVENGSNWALSSCKEANCQHLEYVKKKILLGLSYTNQKHANDDDFEELLESAIKTYQLNYHLKKTRVLDPKTGIGNVYLTIGFHHGYYGDGSPFDGHGGVLAHAFAPNDWRFHYDTDDTWSVGAVEGAIDLKSVALHEIGHLFGLGQSSVEGAIMFPLFPLE